MLTLYADERFRKLESEVRLTEEQLEAWRAGRGQSEKADVDLGREINERQAALGELRRDVANLTEKVLLIYTHKHTHTHTHAHTHFTEKVLLTYKHTHAHTHIHTHTHTHFTEKVLLMCVCLCMCVCIYRCSSRKTRRLAQLR